MEEEKIHLTSLYTCEEKKRQASLVGSWYDNKRVHFIDWFFNVSEKEKLSKHTPYLASFYMDKLCSKYCIYDKLDLVLVGAVCLLLATKFEDKDMHQIKIIDIVTHASCLVSVEKIQEFEWEVFSKLNYELDIATTSMFVDHFLMFDPSNDKQRKALEKYAFFFCELCGQHTKFTVYKQSHIAAASIYCARKTLVLEPLWPKQIIDKADLLYSEFKECASDLWITYMLQFPLDAYRSMKESKQTTK